MDRTSIVVLTILIGPLIFPVKDCLAALAMGAGEKRYNLGFGGLEEVVRGHWPC